VPKSSLPVALPEAPKPAQAIPSGPAWLKGCKAIQLQGVVVMCDADSLLTQPSEKVQVYVRNAALVPREGHFTVRENLPMAYRFFLLQ
jgi:hypothetical protein